MKFCKKKSKIAIHVKIGILTALTLALLTALAGANEQKRFLKNDMTEVYLVLPESAESLSEVFTKGEYYGRLRLNCFYFDYINNELHDPTGFGVGGSLLYKTAPFYGVSATAGLYTSQNLGLLEKDDALFGRAGKGTFSRYNVLKDGDWNMTVLAQAYLQFDLSKSEIKVGRHIFESFLTKSNDTKMIPNTFEGVSIISKDIPETTVKLAFFTAQKLRDHTEFHDVITYGNGKKETYEGWNISRFSNQDDSASHWGLSHENLKAAGKDVDNNLVVAGATNRSVRNLKLDLWYNRVPDLFYSLMAESNYKISLPKGWKLTPGIRYMQQFDNGAGDVGGANLLGTIVNGVDGVSIGDGGYNDPYSVDAKLFAARLVFRKRAGFLRMSYSKVSDDADFIAPWRGFPTGGYTRSMAQYNWYANTESWMMKVFYDFGEEEIIKGFRVCLDYAYMDYDDEKLEKGGLIKTDRYIIHTDMWYKFPFLPDLEAKVRFAYVDAKRTILGIDPSYTEVRFELNYLF